jgi:class 3 adenylate cyclase
MKHTDMPLYMDLHKGMHGITSDDLKNVHQADLDVQDKYGVKYQKFWLNEESGTIFCLVEGPSKEACIAVHGEAHGHLACEIIEVHPSDVALFMGSGETNNIGRAIHTNGNYDSSVRTFLFTDIVGSTDLTQLVGDAKAMTILRKHNQIVRDNIILFNGKEVKHTGDGIMACFDSVFKAVTCAQEIQKNLRTFRDNNAGYPLHIRIGLNTGEPVTEGDDFFGAAVQLAARLCNKAISNQVLVSNIVKELCIGKAVNFIDRGQAELKGFSSPVSVYEVEWT